MADIIASIRNGDLSALGVVLRQAYATGRAQRGVVRAVLQLASSSDAAVPIRCTAYEILWTLAAAVDVSAYRGLVSLARQDIFSADHPDLSIAALSTMRSLPAHLAVDLMLTEDVERQMADAMGGDAQPHVRSACALTFTRLAFHAWMQVSDVRPVGSSRPFDSYASQVRVRGQVLERCTEVLRAVGSLCEDKDSDVASAAFASVRMVLEAAPYATVAGRPGIGDVVGCLPLVTAYAAQGSLLAPGLGSGNGQGDESWDALAARGPHRRCVAELVRRLVPRLGLLVQRLPSLRHAGKANGMRVLALILASAAALTSSRAGPLDAPSLARMDHAGSTAEQGLPSVMASFLTTVVVPAMLNPAAVGGGGAAAAHSFASSADSSAPLATGTAVLAVQIEAARSFTQLAATFAPGNSKQARAAAGSAAVQDLDDVSGGALSRPAYAGEAVARVLACGALAVDVTNTYPLSTLSDMEGADYDSYTGPLWPAVGGNAALASVSSLGHAVDACFARYTPVLLSCITRVLRRIGSVGAGAGVVVATAGVSAIDQNGSSSATSTTSSSGPLGSTDAGIAHGRASGAGGGDDSAALPRGLTQRALFVLTRACELVSPTLFLHMVPAVLRETCRIGDAVVDDPAAGRCHSGPRVALLMRLSAMAVHAAQFESVPDRPLMPYSRATSMTMGGSSLSSSPAPAPMPVPGPTLSTVLARVIHEATRQVSHTLAGGGGTGHEGGTLASDADTHAHEVGAVSTRFRAELTACMLQCLSRAAPTQALLAPLALATSPSRDVGAAKAISDPTARLSTAEALHAWLAFALDTAYSSLWVLEHRLTYAGLATMSRDAAAAALARIMGWPDAPAPAPCPVPNLPPPPASVTGMSLCAGPGREGDQCVGAVPDMFDPDGVTATSSAGSSGGVGTIPGWAWAREYEATAEAADALLTLLCTCASLLLPPATPRTYLPGAQEASGVAIPTALALDLLPPSVLTAHRAGLQRVLHLAFKQELGVCRMAALETAALALAPKVAAAVPSGETSASASMTRRVAFDALPSAVQVQLRLLWLLTAAWDGSDGGALTAGVGAAGTIAAMSLPRSVDAMLAPRTGTDGRPGNGLRALIDTVTRTERSFAGQSASIDVMNDPHEEELYRNTTLAIEAMRQKRLAGLIQLLASEAGTALGIGSDLEASAKRAMAVTSSLAAGRPMPHPEYEPDGTGTGSGGTAIGGGRAAPSPAKESALSGWARGSKIGKALGFFGMKLGLSAPASKDTVIPVYAGQGTVVTQAHFWLLLDMLVQAASMQRCTAMLVRRAVECMLMQPKLSPDIATALVAALPRLSLFTATYGRSRVARDLAGIAQEAGTSVSLAEAGTVIRAAIDSTSIFMAVAGAAHACASSPWDLHMYAPGRSVTADGTMGDAAGVGPVAAMQEQIAAMQAASLPSAPATSLELLADMFSTAPLALLAAASNPELTQGMSMGLNRSNASGACMRTVPPISLAHAYSLASATAALSLHLSPHVTRSAARQQSGTSGCALPIAYLGCVPAEAAIGGADVQLSISGHLARLRMLCIEGRNMLPLPVYSHAASAQRVLDAYAATHVRDCTLRAAQLPSTGSTLSSLSSLAPALHGSVSGLSGDGMVVTSSSDPLSITIGHTYHGDAARLTLHVGVTNMTRFRLPAGMRLSLQLGGPLMFDRSSITAASITSAAARITATSMNGDSASAAAAASGDFVTMQRTSQHHATHVLTQSLHAGSTVTWDVIVSVAGFGSATVRPIAIMECITVEEGEEAAAGAAVLLSRAGRAVGACRAEDGDNDDDGDADFGPGGAGTGEGGCTGDWAGKLTGQIQQPGNDGLIWTGPDLNTPGKIGRFLPGVPGPGLRIMRSSATTFGEIAGPVDPKAGKSGLAALFGGRGGSSSSGTAPSQLSALDTPGRVSTPGEGLATPASGTGQDKDKDAGSTVQGSATGEDDAGSTGSGGDDGEAAVDLDGGDGSSSLRPYKVRRIELTGQAYRLPFWMFLHPVTARLPPSLALALSCGVDLLPGAATGFGYAGLLSPLAAASIDGGGMVVATPEAVTASGSVPSLGSSLFASIAARTPYAHHALAVSQPFMASLPHAFSYDGQDRDTDSGCRQWLDNGPGSAQIPVASPAWLAAVAQQGTGTSWSRIPLTTAPSRARLPLKAAAAAFAESVEKANACVGSASEGRLGRETQLAGDGISQAAYFARTPAGASLVLFFTGVLVPVSTTTSSRPGTAPHFHGPEPCMWQVSVQLRTDDARVRGAIATECPELVHSLFCGRLSVLSHGHSPSPMSALQRLDILTGQPAGSAAGPFAAAVTAVQDASAGMAARLAVHLDAGNGPLSQPLFVHADHAVCVDESEVNRWEDEEPDTTALEESMLAPRFASTAVE